MITFKLLLLLSTTTATHYWIGLPKNQLEFIFFSTQAIEMALILVTSIVPTTI